MYRKLLVGVMALALVAGKAEAQRAAKIGVAGGISLPLSAFGDSAEMGTNLAVSVSFKPAMLPFGVRVEGAWDHFAFDEDEFGIDGTFSSLSATVNAVVDIPSGLPAKVYLIAGVGNYNIDAEYDVGSSIGFATKSKNRFGFNAGAGVNVPVGKLDTFFEARYHQVARFDDGASNLKPSFLPITVGIRF